MFTWLNKQAVRSSDGYEVHFLGRGQAQYREGKRVRTIPVEEGLVAGRPAVLFAKSIFECWDNSSIPLSLVEQERVLGNFLAALRFQGLESDY